MAAQIDQLDQASLRALLPALIDARNELRKDLTAWLANAPDGDERFTAQQYRRALLALDKAAQITDQAEISHFENRRFGILVDGDDGTGVLDAGQVLDGPGNAGGDVELGRNDLAGLADLPVVRRIA